MNDWLYGPVCIGPKTHGDRGARSRARGCGGEDASHEVAYLFVAVEEFDFVMPDHDAVGPPEDAPGFEHAGAGVAGGAHATAPCDECRAFVAGLGELDEVEVAEVEDIWPGGGRRRGAVKIDAWEFGEDLREAGVQVEVGLVRVRGAIFHEDAAGEDRHIGQHGREVHGRRLGGDGEIPRQADFLHAAVEGVGLVHDAHPVLLEEVVVGAKPEVHADRVGRSPAGVVAGVIAVAGEDGQPHVRPQVGALRGAF